MPFKGISYLIVIIICSFFQPALYARESNKATNERVHNKGKVVTHAQKNKKDPLHLNSINNISEPMPVESVGPKISSSSQAIKVKEYKGIGMSCGCLYTRLEYALDYRGTLDYERLIQYYTSSILDFDDMAVGEVVESPIKFHGMEAAIGYSSKGAWRLELEGRKVFTYEAEGTRKSLVKYKHLLFINGYLDAHFFRTLNFYFGLGVGAPLPMDASYGSDFRNIAIQGRVGLGMPLGDRVNLNIGARAVAAASFNMHGKKISETPISEAIPRFLFYDLVLSTGLAFKL